MRRIQARLNLFLLLEKRNLKSNEQILDFENYLSNFPNLSIDFDPSVVRGLDYYTGMVFKIDIKSKSKIINCCNGGRYDKLISDLGSKKQIPAVGAAFNLNYQS